MRPAAIVVLAIVLAAAALPTGSAQTRPASRPTTQISQSDRDHWEIFYAFDWRKRVDVYLSEAEVEASTPSIRNVRIMCIRDMAGHRWVEARIEKGRYWLIRADQVVLYREHGPRMEP